MFKRMIASAAMTALLVPVTSLAAGPSWNYLDAGLVRDGDLEDDNGGSIDTDGLDFEAAAGFGEWFFLQASHEAGDVDADPDLALDRFAIGPGLTTDLQMGSTVIAPWARVNYRRDNVGNMALDGYGAAAGLRWQISPVFEAAVSGEYGDTERSNGGNVPDTSIEETTYELALRYAVSPSWMLTAAYRTSELEPEGPGIGTSDEFDHDRLVFGARWNYAGGPDALAAGDDGIAADSDNYMDALYVFGDDAEAKSDAGRELADIERGTLVRASAALTEHVIFQGSVLNTDLEADGVDQIAADWYSLGPGLSFTDEVGAGEMDLFGTLTYERIDLAAAGLYDGAGATVGARYRIAGFEFVPSVKLFTTDARADEDLEGEQYSLDVLYAVSESVSLVANATRSNGELDESAGNVDFEQTVYGAGVRFYYGGKS